jgi:hypothetical protein
MVSNNYYTTNGENFMDERSLIGTFHNRTSTFQATHCHNDGVPLHQVPALATAAHVYHQDNPDLLKATLLEHSWSLIDPRAATTAAEDHQPAAVHGIGFRYLNEPVYLTESRLGAGDADPDYLFMYLFDDATNLLVFTNEQGVWMLRRLFTPENFPHIVANNTDSSGVSVTHLNDIIPTGLPPHLLFAPSRRTAAHIPGEPPQHRSHTHLNGPDQGRSPHPR